MYIHVKSKVLSMKVTESRIAVIQEKSNELHISIPSKKYWGIVIWCIICVVILCYEFVSLWKSEFSTEVVDQTDGADYFFAVILFCFMIILVFFLLWSFFGKETLTVKRTNTTLKKQIFGLGSTRTFYTSRIEKIQFNEVKLTLFNRARNTKILLGIEGKIKFRYGTKNYAFGMALSDEEAKHVVEKLEDVTTEKT